MLLMYVLIVQYGPKPAMDSREPVLVGVDGLEEAAVYAAGLLPGGDDGRQGELLQLLPAVDEHRVQDAVAGALEGDNKIGTKVP